MALAAFGAEMEAARANTAARLDHDDTRGRLDDDGTRPDDNLLMIAHAGARHAGDLAVKTGPATPLGLSLHRNQRGQHGTGEHHSKCIAHVDVPPTFVFKPPRWAPLRTNRPKAQDIAS
jgi:hypothetical protein